MYKVVFVCGLSRKGTQRQTAFISKASDDVRLDSDCAPLWREIHLPLIDVNFFKTFKKSMEYSLMFAPKNEIFLWDKENNQWKAVEKTK